MFSSSKATIVWIDDHFLTKTFQEDIRKNAWHKLFGKINSNMYRLLDINIKFIRTAEDAEAFINSPGRFTSNEYYYFIVDRKLPYKETEEAVDSSSENIVRYLQNYQKKFQSLDFSILSSGSPDSYAIKNVDYYLKPQNKEFTLPDELRHKILFKIKENIDFIDQYTMSCENKINIFGIETGSVDFENYSALYPFIGKYRSFVELEEVSRKDFSTLIVMAQKSISDQFIMQNLFVSLYDQLKSYNGINYYKDSDYSKLKLNGYFEDIAELTDQLPVIRLNEWNLESYKKLHKHLRHKRLKVFVIDAFDDNVSAYIDMSLKAKIIKVENIENTQEVAENITSALTQKVISESKLILENTIYENNNILFLHPLMYRMITDNSIHIEVLDDPSEIINALTVYFDGLNIKYIDENDDLFKNTKESLPFKIDYIFMAKKIKDFMNNDKLFNTLLVNTVDYWLRNAWNVNYNIDFDNISTQEQWQEYSFNVLCEMLNDIDFSTIADDKQKRELSGIKEATTVFSSYIQGSHNTDIRTTNILWPHEKYPMQTYVLNQLYKSSNKKLYLQDKDLSFIDNAPELEISLKNLECKLSYYRSLYKLVEDTHSYFPSEISSFIQSLSTRIRTNKDIFITKDNKLIIEDKENFKKLTNILLRIAINFGLLVNKTIVKDKLNYKRNAQQPFSEDLAGLGLLVQDFRDHVHKECEPFVYELNELKSTTYLNLSSNKEFMINSTKLLDSQKQVLFDISKVKNTFQSINVNKNLKKTSNLVIVEEDYIKDETLVFKKGAEVEERDLKDYKNVKYRYKDLDKTYANKLYVTNNSSMYSQLANLSSYLSSNERILKIHKHKNAYMLFAYLADSRNTWEHGDDKAWSRELFTEYFIYSQS